MKWLHDDSKEAQEHTTMTPLPQCLQCLVGCQDISQSHSTFSSNYISVKTKNKEMPEEQKYSTY